MSRDMKTMSMNAARNHRRSIFSTFISAALIRRLSSDLSSLLSFVRFRFDVASLFSFAGLRNSRGTPGAPSSLSPYSPVRSLSRGPSCFVPSVPSAQCDIYGFLLGPCVEAAIIPEREKSSPRFRRPSPSVSEYGPKCGSQGRQAATDDDDNNKDNDDDDDNRGDGGGGGGDENDTRVRVQRFWDCFSPSSFFREKGCVRLVR